MQMNLWRKREMKMRQIEDEEDRSEEARETHKSKTRVSRAEKEERPGSGRGLFKK
jgi:hypothetical protein